MILYYDRKGQPLEMLEWARLCEDNEYRVVAQHWVRGWMVSTVWLGLNHNFIGKRAVLDGEIDEFIEAGIRWRAANRDTCPPSSRRVP